MQRRAFVCAVASLIACGRSDGVRAQGKAMPVVGFLHAASPQSTRLEAFRRGLRDNGYTEGGNVAVVYRWADGRFETLPELARELVRSRVDVIATPGNTAAAVAAKAATTTIPIVFGVSEDPVRFGLVASLGRPGGNATGVNYLATEIVAKRLGVLHEALPRATRIAAIVNPANATNAQSTVKELRAAGRALGLEIQSYDASTAAEIDSAFAALARRRPDAVFVAPDSYYSTRREQLVRLANRYGLPAVYSVRDYVEAGGLMSYGPSITDMFHRVGTYTAKVLGGRKPAELPVEQVARLELVVNLATAKALGIAIPQAVLLRADDVVS